MFEQRTEEEYRAKRKNLVERFEALDSVSAIFDLQLDLVAEIRSTEPRWYIHRDDDARYHLRQLRLIGDALAWRLLHPYSIRKLGALDVHPPSLSNQGSAFDGTIEAAREWTAKGEPVVIADITNCLTIGDVVVCTHPERPMLVESGGGSLDHVGEGRKGRQMRRSLSTLQLLHRGSARIEGDTKPTRTLELEHDPEYSWTSVESAVRANGVRSRLLQIASAPDAAAALRCAQVRCRRPSRSDSGPCRP